MPYYQWSGVDIRGNRKKGKLFARNSTHLDSILMMQEIALISHKEPWQWIKKSIRVQDKVQCFQELAVLIEAAILLPDALHIVGDQLTHPPLQELVHTLAYQVQAGCAFHEAAEQYPELFDTITIQLIRAGEESNRMVAVLDAIVCHIALNHDFSTKVRAALLLPAITFVFFIGAVLTIFLLIMPRLVELCASMKQEIPPLTQKIIAISALLTSPLMGVYVAVAAFFIGLAWRATRKGNGRQALDWVILHTPIIGPLYVQRFMGYTLQALAVLLQGGMPLVQALGIIRYSINNRLLSTYFSGVELQVAAGSSLSEALMRQGSFLGWGTIATPHLIAMVEVGQESGKLALLLNRAGRACYERVAQRLSRIAILVQPAMLIILGLLVALLIFSVYGPIFLMSSGV